MMLARLLGADTEGIAMCLIYFQKCLFSSFWKLREPLEILITYKTMDIDILKLFRNVQYALSIGVSTVLYFCFRSHKSLLNTVDFLLHASISLVMEVNIMIIFETINEDNTHSIKLSFISFNA